MAAGLGFKTFTVGEVLSAADVNGYLMQGVLVFATTAARDAAITSPQEGQFAFTKDTNSLFYYDGAAWVASGATGDIEGVTAGVGISGGGTSGTVTVTNSMATAIDAKGDLIVGTGADTFSRLAVGTNGQVLIADSAEATGLKFATPSSAGKVLQVVSFEINTTKTSTTNSYVDTDLTATITPTLNTSKVLVLITQGWQLYIASAGAEMQGDIKLLRGSTLLGSEAAQVIRAAGYVSELSSRTNWAYTYLDSPATTSATTYKTQFKNTAALGSFRVNNNSSTITLLEIGA